MDTISYTSARANLASTMEKVREDHSPIIITRKSENPVVMISLEDYHAMEETTYLLRSPVNQRQLLGSVAELEAGNGVTRELIEWNSFFLLSRGSTIFICAVSTKNAEANKHFNKKNISLSPYEGTGKPESLRYGLAGYCSRRIKMNIGSFINTKIMQYSSHSFGITTVRNTFHFITI